MAEDEKKEKKEDQQPAEETSAEETPAEETPAEETPAEDAPAEDAPAEDAPTEDAPTEEAPADEGGDEPSPDPDTPAGEAEDVAGDGDELEGMDWKARARLERSRQSGEAGPERSPDERAAERAERRGMAAKRRRAYRGRSRQRRKGSGEGTPPAERDSVAAKTRQGTVVSSKADKTITVRIDIVRRHPAYEKIVRRSSKLHAHDERNEAGEGDVVRLVETRPLSRTKRWRLAEILEKAK